MTPLLVAALATLPCLYWTQGIETKPALEAAGITRLCVPPAQADLWRAAGFAVTPVSEAELAAREALPAPGITARAGLASPTRSPWIVANGWRVTRHPGGKFLYDVPAGKAAIVSAEAFAYGADAVLRIDPADLASFGGMTTFLQSVPASDLPTLADLAIVDDGSAVVGEVLNLLARRNLQFQIVPAPLPGYRVNVVLGSPPYPLADAADPSAFALKIRRQIGDEQRTLRVYGSEAVICRVTAREGRARLHLLNYGGRDIEGLRIRLRGSYREGEALVAGSGRLALTDYAVADGFTEFSVPRLSAYAVIDLK